MSIAEFSHSNRTTAVGPRQEKYVNKLAM